MTAEVASSESKKRVSMASLVAIVQGAQVRNNIPAFRPGDTLRVHAKIVEGTKERVQIFEGVVIRRKKSTGPSATFTVRKISYDVGVERTFLLHSPRIEKIEVVSRGIVRRAKLFYLRAMKGKAGRIKSRFEGAVAVPSTSVESTPEAAPAA